MNSKSNLQIFITRIRGEEAFTAKQKINDLKKLLFKSKKYRKILQAKESMQKNNFNSIASTKYGYPLEEIDVKSLKDDKFREICDFYRLVKVRQNVERNERNNWRKDKLKERRMRELLNIGEKNIVSAERLRKKDAPRNLHKPTTENISFF